jgi:hypothetical protein
MNVQQQIADHIAAQPERKRNDMQTLHGIITALIPDCRLWFLDGKNERGRIVSNPNIGYGFQEKTYADGSTRAFYQIGISGNTTGISVYIMGLEDSKFLADTFGQALGKAKVTGYCIKFRTLSDISIDTLEAAMRAGIDQSSG